MKVRQWMCSLLLVAAALLITIEIAEAGPRARRAARWNNGSTYGSNFMSQDMNVAPMTVAGTQPQNMQPGTFVVIDQPYGRRGYARPSYVWTGNPNFFAVNPTVQGTQGTGSYRSFYAPLNDRQVQVDLRLPPNAEVWFNGAKTNQTGLERSYISPSTLTPGKEYVYDIKVRWMKDGQPVEKTEPLTIRAGERKSLDFQNNQQPTP